MKKLTLFVAFTMLLQLSFAGGLLTNYNQSAQYVRMLSRNAALEIDAVFYNPAGLVKLEDGWHFAFHSQTIFQTREISSGFPLLNQPAYYEGETQIPVFPNLYGVYKKDKWAFSLGIGPAAGGGTATFANGMPTFEIPVSKAVPALAGLGQIDPSLAVTGYGLDMNLDASSIFWGIQLGATYAINDKISVYGGVRIVPATNKYQGSISNIQLQANGQMNAAPGWLNGAATTVNGYAAQASAGADIMYGSAGSMQPIIDNGGGPFTLEQLVQVGSITPAQKAQLEGGLLYIGVPQAQIDMMSAAQVQGTYSATGDQLTGTVAILNGTAQSLNATSAAMQDKEVDTQQTGMGVTPILGFNYSPNDDWNVGFKYEMKTKLNLTNETTVDDMGLFPDGAKTSSDIPGIISAGIGYRGTDWLEAQLSYNLYLDGGVDWGNNVRYSSAGHVVKREVDNSGHEFALGLQFNLSEKFAISVGGLALRTGVAESWQSDFSFSNDANGIGGGIMWKITDKLLLDAGFSNIFYEDETVTFTDMDIATPDNPTGAYSDTYGKKSLSVAVGLSYSIF